MEVAPVRAKGRRQEASDPARASRPTIERVEDSAFTWMNGPLRMVVGNISELRSNGGFKSIVLLELCAGMGPRAFAANQYSAPVEAHFFSEVCEDASFVLQTHFPDVVPLGCVLKLAERAEAFAKEVTTKYKDSLICMTVYRCAPSEFKPRWS